MPVLTPYMISCAARRSFDEGAAGFDALDGARMQLDLFAATGDGFDVFDCEGFA